MLKTDFLKRLGLIACAAPIAAIQTASPADAASDSDVLVGLWSATVSGQAIYKYVYSISRGTYVATGNIDEGFMNFKFGPTLGEYTQDADGSYRYRERVWVFDMKGNNVGWATSTGTFRLDHSRSTFSGPGTYTQYDLHSKVVMNEKFMLTATRDAV